MQNEDKASAQQISIFSFIWNYLKERKLCLFFSMFTTLVWSIEISLSPYLLKVIIDLAGLYPENSSETFSSLFLPASLYILVSLLLNLNFRINDYVKLKLYPQLKADIMRDLHSYLIRHSYSFFQNNLAGSLTKKISDIALNIESIIRMIMDSFLPIICALISACFTLLIVVHYMVAAVLLIWSSVFIIISYCASKKIEKFAKKVSELEVEANGRIGDSITNIKNIKLFSINNHEIMQITNILDQVVNTDLRLHWQNLKISFLQGLGMTIFTFFLLASLIYGRIGGWVTIGDFALVITLSISILGGVYNVGQQIQQFTKMKGRCEEAFSIIQTPHEIVQLPEAKAIKIKTGLIEFKNVTFHYKGKKNLFKNLSISLLPGEKVGLVGYSGGGKSTFINLILRLIDVQSGTISIDSQNIKEVTISSLMDNITVVPQNPDIFHRSIMENIRLAKPNATDIEVIEASKKAKCHDFICTLADGYESYVGERGIKLSEGQKQRLAIARAILKNSSILLLDEATAALDSVTENDIQRSLYKLMKNKTTIVIAHRLSTLKKIDRILVFDNGNIVEDGKLETLLKKKDGVFYKLWQTQANGFI